MYCLKIWSFNYKIILLNYRYIQKNTFYKLIKYLIVYKILINSNTDLLFKNVLFLNIYMI